MRTSHHRSGAALMTAVGLIVAACGTAASASPSAPSSAAASPSAQPSVAASASDPSGACPLPTTTGALASNTLIGVEVEGGTTADRMTFSFGEAADIPTEPMGRLSAATPPFTMAGSGLEATVTGDRFLEVTFTGLLIADDQGTPTFQSARDRRTGNLVAIKHYVVTDESEGQMTFIVGYAGDGCVALGRDSAAGNVTIDITHTPG